MGWTLPRATLCVLSVAVALPSAAPPADGLYPLAAKTAAAWAEYLKVTEFRIKNELEAPARFLALDFASRPTDDRQAVLSGKIPVAEMITVWQNGTEVTVPDHWVHHWRGAVLLPGQRLDGVFERLKRDMPGKGQPGVLKAEIRQQDWPRLHTYIQVQRKGSFVVAYNFVYNTEHDVEFRRLSPTHGTSRTVATKIVELYHPGSPEEREMTWKEENRYLVRWNSYWRYQEIGAGVIAECESVTLSKDPGSLLSMAGAHKVAAGQAEDAMLQALLNLRTFFRTPPAMSPAR
ncbi:MAG TPA: hypothetical protein VFV78_06775 [Vicinamibacterales bacterium]|nr:hypothetical protein [Vicinamibacterales bacterium]